MKITIPGTPVAKPRMTQRDKWMKRDCVMKYRAYADELRRVVNKGKKLEKLERLLVEFILPMPKSWSKKKKYSMSGGFHRVKPDLSNLIKAVEDSLLENDQSIHTIEASKTYEQPGIKNPQTILYNL